MDDPTNPGSDAPLIDATLAALRDERRRAPADLLAILTLVLVIAAGLVLAAAIALGDGVARDVLLNLTGEILGAALTFVLIGGLWQRLQSSSEGAMEDLVARTAARRGGTLSAEERVAFLAIVELHRRTATRGFLSRMITGVIYAVRNRQRLKVLEDMLRAA
jgi:hypothetical protein